MSRQRTRRRDPGSHPFAVECPSCRAHVAVARDLVGRAAGCPACHAPFLVPPPEREEARLPGSFERRRRPPAGPVAASDDAGHPAGPPAAITPTPGPSVAPTPRPAPAMAERAAPPHDADVRASVSPREDVAPDPGAPLVFSAPPVPSTRRDRAEPVVAAPHDASAAAHAHVGFPGPAVEPEIDAATPAPDSPAADSPAPESPGPDPAAPALAFRDPIKTVRSGGTEIELRQLTAEERRSRRSRRNVLILVVGAAILVALVVILGSGGR